MRSVGDAVACSHVVAFIDLGTNSVRLMVVRVEAEHSYGVISLQREAIRLGEHEFAVGRLQPAAMDRAVLVCRSFVDLARSYEADEIIAVATSATREAENRAEFLDRLRHEAGLEVHSISGLEEARLVYLGVRSRVEIGAHTALVIDIGGGSTEVVVGTHDRHLHLDSLSLGALRVTNAAFAEYDDGPVSDAAFQELLHRVKLKSAHAVQDLRRYRIDVAYGTSGTIRNLAAAASRVLHDRLPERDQRLTRGDLRKLGGMVRGMSVAERAEVPGINPERADIIVAGAAILESLMTDIGVKEIRALDECGVREGLLVDYLQRTGRERLVRGLTVRERSVVQLARACKFDEAHARRVRARALELFDSANAAGLHDQGARERELLAHAAMLHDIGVFLSYRDHHIHSAYLVRNAELLGFDQDEVEIMAAAILFHRKAMPGSRNSGLSAMRRRDRDAARSLGVLLRLAERLDRSRTGCVRAARLVVDGDEAVLELETAGDCQLELWSIDHRRVIVERALGRRLVVRQTTADAAGGRS